MQQPAYPQPLLSLQEAASILSVSVDTLLLWNTYNILKPTITLEGQIGYTKHQLDQFLVIRQSIQNAGFGTTPIQQPLPASQPATAALSYGEPVNKSVAPQAVTKISLPMPTLVTSIFVKHSQAQRVFASVPPIMFLVATICILMAATVFPVYGIKTSTMALSGNRLATLPIQLRNDTQARKSLTNEGESITREKIIAPALYAVKSEKRFAFGDQAPVITPSQRPESGISIDYAETQGTYMQSAASDTDAVIDEDGHIRGDAKADTLTSIVAGIDQLVKSDSFKKVNTDSTNQMVLLVIGGLAMFFVLQKQFAFSVKKAPIVHIQPYQTATKPVTLATAPQKILEVRQKTDGTVVLVCQGKEYKISKPELNSESDKLIEQLMILTQGDVKEIEFDMLASDAIRFITPLSRLVTRLGFVGIKRDLFFPRTSKSTVLFRRYLTDQDLLNMQLTPDQIFTDFS